MESKSGIQKLPKDHILFTSESVTAGHPDKLCDFISDSILDACLAQDPESKVACESAVKNNMVMVFGEINTKAKIVVEQVVREAIKEVGYDSLEKGMDYKTATIIIGLDHQSPEIAESVHVGKKDEDIGAGDQGLMIGYSTDETPEFMPLSHALSSALAKKLREVRLNKTCPDFLPDGKTQVTVEYIVEGQTVRPLRVDTILISTQHKANLTQEEIISQLREHVIKPVIPSQYLDEKTKYYLNPSGSFIVGGPHGDAGLTGRKIIVDTYGGWGGHGGGAFSGKDSTKVDRSAAYAARWVAKSLVANGFCKRALVQVAYGIGLAFPISLHIFTYGTCLDGFTEEDLHDIVIKNFDLRPGVIIKDLDLKKPYFKKLSVGGHFGRDEPEFLWEKPKDLTHEKVKKSQKAE